jgi:molecular chaperone HtpG
VDDLKLFINYGMLTEEKFYDKAKDFALLKNEDGKYFTYDEYKKLIKENQTDQEKNLSILCMIKKSSLAISRLPGIKGMISS